MKRQKEQQTTSFEILSAASPRSGAEALFQGRRRRMFVLGQFVPLPEGIRALAAVSFSAEQCLEGLRFEGDAGAEGLWRALWGRLTKEYWSHYGGGVLLLDGCDSWYETRGGLRFGFLCRYYRDDSMWVRPWIRRPAATEERPDKGTLRAACLAAGWEEVPDDSLPRLRQEARG